MKILAGLVRKTGKNGQDLDTHLNFQYKCLLIILNQALFQKYISFPLLLDSMDVMIFKLSLFQQIRLVNVMLFQ